MNAPRDTYANGYQEFNRATSTLLGDSILQKSAPIHDSIIDWDACCGRDLWRFSIAGLTDIKSMVTPNAVVETLLM